MNHPVPITRECNFITSYFCVRICRDCWRDNLSLWRWTCYFLLWPTGVMGEAKTWGGWPTAVDGGAAHIQWGQSLHCRVPVPKQLEAPDQIHKQERRGNLWMSDFHTPTESYTDTSTHQRWVTYWNRNTEICSFNIVHCV